MADTSSLVNRALALISAPRVTSIEGTDATSQLIRDTYDDIRQSLIRGYSWNFAKFRSRLGLLQGTSPVGFLYSYEKPQATATRGPWLSTLGVFTDDEMQRPADYEDAGGTIQSDATALVMLALHDILDPTVMDAGFRTALSYRLAAEYAIILSNSNQMRDTYMQMAASALLSAQASNDMDLPSPAETPGSWLTARNAA